MKFIHDRMPVILDPGSEAIRTWLDPQRHQWSKDLQNLLRPFEGSLDIYPVSKEVGKVGNNSPSFIIPLDSKDNKSNIANFFANASKKSDSEKKGLASPKKDYAGHSGTVGLEPMHSSKRSATGPADPRESPPKKPATSKKISATRNENKTPSKNSNVAGSQKITKFFGNSA